MKAKANYQDTSRTLQAEQSLLFEEPKTNVFTPPAARNIIYFLNCYLDRDFLKQKSERDFLHSTTKSH